MCPSMSEAAPASRSLGRSLRTVPSFSLYGDAPAPAALIDGVHIEDIQTRSRKYLWKIAAHRHTVLSQCVWVSAGPVTAVLDETRANFTGPAVIVIPAGTVHSFRFRADTQGHVLTTDLAQLLSVASAAHRSPIETLFSAPRALDLRQDSQLPLRLRQLLDILKYEFRQPDSVNAPVASWLACSVLWILALAMTAHGAAELPAVQDAQRLRRFRHLIESHYLKHWPVQRYARQLALSSTSLNRLCRQLAGSTAFDLIQQRVALEARRRLVYDSGPVSRVAAELGFKDPAYFSRFFRRHGGLSPNEFRRRHR
jgi:AraC family transcriptional regulator, transcriptional activator of pobA